MTKIDTSTEAIAKLMDGVTPGPWRVHDCESMGHRCTIYYQEIWNDETDILVMTEVTRAHNDGGAKNMRFIAAARDLVPALTAERDAAVARAEKAEGALIWCSGSDDFQDGGKAREGWLKLCAPIINAALPEAKGEK